MASLEPYGSDDLTEGATCTSGQLRQVAFDLRYADEPANLPTNEELLAVALEALANTKDEAAQLRKEFEALKSQILRKDR